VHPEFSSPQGNDIPFPTFNIKRGVTQISSEQGFITFAVGSFYTIPLDEVSGIGYKKNGEIRVFGRRARNSPDMKLENLLPTQAGFERFKYSRFEEKSIIKLSLKSVSLPLAIL
jgi:hypothetical protein